MGVINNGSISPKPGDFSPHKDNQTAKKDYSKIDSILENELLKPAGPLKVTKIKRNEILPSNQSQNLESSFSHDSIDLMNILEANQSEVTAHVSADQIKESVKSSLEDEVRAPLIKSAVKELVKKSNFNFKGQIILEKILNIFFSGILKKLNRHLYRGANVELRIEQKTNQIKKLKTQLEKLESKRVDHIFADNDDVDLITAKMADTNEKIKECEEFIKTQKGYADKGEKMHQTCKVLGGESIKIKPEGENIELNGVYLSAQNFRQAMQKFQGEIGTLTLANGNKINGFYFEKNLFEGSKLEDALINMGIHDLMEMVVDDNGNLFFVTPEDLKQMEQHSSFDNDGRLITTGEGYSFSHKEIDLNKDPNGGTVILTTGNGGVYEMHKREILAFLLKGMNVMTFNFRGFGLSTGKPSGDGLKRDMEAAYQYLKSNYPIDDSKIMLKALCMSGGPATHLASRHQRINLFLDQSFADYKSVISNQISRVLSPEIAEKDSKFVKSVKEWFQKNIKYITRIIATIISPAWDTQKKIGKIQGHVGLLATKGDKVMDFEVQAQANLQARLKANKEGKTSLYTVAGEHGESWLSSNEILTKIRFKNEKEINQALEKFISENFQDIEDIFGEGEFKSIIKMATNKLRDYQEIEKKQTPEEVEACIIKFLDDYQYLFEERALIYEALSAIFYVDKTENYEPVYAGRNAMDHFLTKAKLKGNLFG